MIGAPVVLTFVGLVHRDADRDRPLAVVGHIIAVCACRLVPLRAKPSIAEVAMDLRGGRRRHDHLDGWIGPAVVLPRKFRKLATYGSLGAAIALMMWMWMSTVVILFGAELNSEIEHQTTADSAVGAPRPMGSRDAKMADTVGAST